MANKKSESKVLSIVRKVGDITTLSEVDKAKESAVLDIIPDSMEVLQNNVKALTKSIAMGRNGKIITAIMLGRIYTETKDKNSSIPFSRITDMYGLDKSNATKSAKIGNAFYSNADNFTVDIFGFSEGLLSPFVSKDIKEVIRIFNHYNIKASNSTALMRELARFIKGGKRTETISLNFLDTVITDGIIKANISEFDDDGKSKCGDITTEEEQTEEQTEDEKTSKTVLMYKEGDKINIDGIMYEIKKTVDEETEITDYFIEPIDFAD